MDHIANYSLLASDKKLNIYCNMDKYILKIEVSHFAYCVTYFKREFQIPHSKPFILGKSVTRNSN